MIARVRDLYRYRELVRNLILRDLKVRYRNSALGILWAFGNPILMTIVFTTVFKVLLKSDIQKFPLFILIGWLSWTFTINAIEHSIVSVVQSSNLIKKIYFPREALPTSTVLADAVNFALGLPLVAALMLYYHVNPAPLLYLYLPFIFVAHLALVLGLAYILAALNVYYRDTAVITNVLFTAWFFLSPVTYPMEYLPGEWNGIEISRLMYILNPMASIIEAYRNVLYGSVKGGPPGTPDFLFLGRTLLTAFIVLLIGYLFFLRLSKNFGEEL
jgi:lipopolysaccharide transport system permease protein